MSGYSGGFGSCNTGRRHYITENSARLFDFSLLKQYFNFFLSQFPTQFFVRYSLIYFECIFSTLLPTKRLCVHFAQQMQNVKFHTSSVIFLTLQDHWITKMFIKSENSNQQEKWKTQTQVGHHRYYRTDSID